MTPANINIPQDEIESFCRRWKITELALFGSALREDFGPDSDVDVLVEFEPDAQVGFLTLAGVQRELGALIGRPVDLVPKGGLKLAIRKAVLDAAEVVYEA